MRNPVILLTAYQLFKQSILHNLLEEICIFYKKILSISNKKPNNNYINKHSVTHKELFATPSTKNDTKHTNKCIKRAL